LRRSGAGLPVPRSDRSRLNINLGWEGAVNGTLVRYLEQPFSLFWIEVSHELNLALDAIDLACLGFAVPAIRRVDLRMAKIHDHTFERPLFRARVKGYRHRRAGTERCEKQIVGSRSSVFPAKFYWFIRGQPMWTDNDLLGEPRGVAAYDYIRGIHAPTLPLSRPAASGGGIFAVRVEKKAQ
jgi:hypothetical protein